MEIKIQGISEMFNIIGELFNGLKSTAKILETVKKDMRDALANTAELIDETLTILKQHLSTVAAELKYGDEVKARKMILELSNFHAWEHKFRQFELCDTLRNAALNLERKGLYKLKTKVGYANPEELKQAMWDYIGGEANAANSVSEMLIFLSGNADFEPGKKDEMITRIETARDEVSQWRKKFIDLEKKIRAGI
ncbi:MAG: hypothetical protein CVU11_17090 [Bacteroidetes bacterium HGW-Bacteroidetes-6]|nr:MAG: hypothetical protein CVU11_17090 [Bacteroidetes bacterium HGW-Bacteroidetes-6]